MGYSLKNWTALNRCYAGGDLEVDNNAVYATIGIGAVPRSLLASCQHAGVEPFAWFNDVLSRIGDHPITRLPELLPYNWASTQA